MEPIIQELQSLLFDWEAKTLSDEGAKRLRELLHEHEEAREFFAEYQLLSVAMRLEFDMGRGGPVDSAPGPISLDMNHTSGVPESNSRRAGGSHFLRVNYWVAAAATLLFAALGGRVFYLELEDRIPPNEQAESPLTAREEAKEPTSQGVAVLTRLVDVEWSPGQPKREVGDALSPERLSIQAGYVQIEFFCGATVVVEGPAELDLQTPMLARVLRGRLRAQVPPAARGFSLLVDDLRVIDLGTEFGLSVSNQGANLQVFDGEVELQQPKSEKRMLVAGEGIVRSANGLLQEVEVTPERFLDIATLESRAEGQQDQRFERWQKASRQMRHDRRLIAYYAFDQQSVWRRRLVSSIDPANRELDGAIVGAHPVTGRWTTKSALEFKRPGDRVRVQIPGEFSSLTLACWVKIDSLDRWYNSLFLTDHYNQGEPHWQILDTGQLFFSVRHKPDDAQGATARQKTHQPIVSPPFWKPAMSGRWLHLATSYDAPTGRVTHYLNGEHLHDELIDESLRVPTTRIGAASIGNWSLPTRSDAEFAIRNLNGSVDEFAIYAAALSAEEIMEMFENGKP